MNTTAVKTTTTSMMYLIQDIVLDVSWAKISQHYFPDRSASWLYNKLRGVDGNGGEGAFTSSEKAHFKNALFDFSERIRNAANMIQ